MARVQFSALVADMKGRLGGSVFQGGKGGTILRNNAWRGGAKTQRWQIARQKLVFFANQWTQLSIGNKNAWNAYGEGIETAGVFGDPVTMTGQNAYIMVTANRDICGLAPLDTPIISSGISIDPNATLTVNGANDLELNWVFGNAAFQLVVKAKRQYAGDNLSSPGGFKQIISQQLSGVPPFDVTSNYQAGYGSVFADISFIYQWRIIQRSSGISTGWFQKSAIVI